MDAMEQQELRDLRDRIVKLETLIKLEFRHLKNDWKILHECIQKLNNEYGKLIEKETDLEVRHAQLQRQFKESILHWKIAAIVISPTITTLIVKLIEYLT